MATWKKIVLDETSPSFSGLSVSGDLNLSYTYPRINLTDTNNNSDYSIINNDGSFSIYDVTNNSHRLSINSSGDASFSGNAWIKRPSNKVDNSNCTELPSRVEFNNSFASGQSGYMIFRYPTYNNFLIAGDYDGHIGGTIPNIQFGKQSTVYMHINSSDGKVGIGTDSPAYKLQVNGGSSSNNNDANTIVATGTEHVRLKIHTPTTGGYRASLVLSSNEALSGTSNEVSISTTGNDDMQFGTGGSTKMTLDSSGNVGIGVTPSEKLTVQLGADATGIALRTSYSGNAKIVDIYQSASDGFINVASANGSVVSRISGYASTSTYFLSNVGIGTTSPAYQLTLNKDDNNYLQIRSSDAGAAGIYFGRQNDSVRGSIYYDNNADALYFKTNNLTTSTVITSGGNVGIGISNPENKLHVYDIIKISPFATGDSGGYLTGNNATLRLINGDIYNSSNYAGIEFGGMYNPTGNNRYNATYNYIKWASGELKISNNQQDKIIVGGGDEWGRQNLIFNPNGGNVGIGVAPSYKLEISDSQATDIPIVKLTNTNGSDYTQGYHAISPNMGGHFSGYVVGQNFSARNAGQIGFKYISAGSTSNYLYLGGHSVDDVLVVQMTGNVGIGTTDPGSYKLNVNGTGNFSGALTGTSATFSGKVTLSNSSWANHLQIDRSGNGIYFAPDPTITYINAVGGTTKLQLGLDLQANAITGTSATFSGNVTLGDDVENTVTINASTVSIPSGLNFDNDTFVIDSTNNRVGIGTSSPSTKLTLSISSDGNLLEMIGGARTSDSYAGKFIFSTAQSTNYNRSWVFANNSGTLSIKRISTSDGSNDTSGDIALNPNGGNVGIGTTSPALNLHVNGTDGSRYSYSTTAGQAFDIVPGANATAGVILRATHYNQDYGPMVFYTGGTERARIDSSGNVGIGTNSPDTNTKLDVAGKIRTSTGIMFGTDTADANTLDDYEEGTFTATLSPTSGTVYLNSGYNTLAYTKIGRVVTITGQLAITSVSGASGYLYLGNLPAAITMGNNTASSAQTRPSIHVYAGTGSPPGYYSAWLGFNEGSTSAAIFITYGTGSTNASSAANWLGAGSDIFVNFSYIT